MLSPLFCNTASHIQRNSTSRYAARCARRAKRPPPSTAGAGAVAAAAAAAAAHVLLLLLLPRLFLLGCCLFLQRSYSALEHTTPGSVSQWQYAASAGSGQANLLVRGMASSRVRQHIRLYWPKGSAGTGPVRWL